MKNVTKTTMTWVYNDIPSNKLEKFIDSLIDHMKIYDLKTRCCYYDEHHEILNLTVEYNENDERFKYPHQIEELRYKIGRKSRKKSGIRI